MDTWNDASPPIIAVSNPSFPNDELIHVLTRETRHLPSSQITTSDSCLSCRNEYACEADQNQTISSEQRGNRKGAA